MTAMQPNAPASFSNPPSKRTKRTLPSLNLAAVSKSSSVFLVTSDDRDTEREPDHSCTATLHSSLQSIKTRLPRNPKKLSLSIPASAASNSSTTSLLLPDIYQLDQPHPQQPTSQPPRRASIVSLPPVGTTAVLHRRDENDSPSIPYLQGPIEIVPKVWIGTEDNARDWKGLRERGIKSILNVAKELSGPFEAASGALRTSHSASDLKQHSDVSMTYYPPHLPSGRPAFHYLKLPWSHGQTNLVKEGFPVAMTFIDESHSRGDGVLIHCQCGVSRSATLIIAFVMREAAFSDDSTDIEIRALKGGGMHAAYAYVKERSKWVGPNMSLIYQLLDYERTLQSGNTSPSSSVLSSRQNEAELDWGRQRQAMEQQATTETESSAFDYEAKALDLEMEERNVARKASQSSMASVSSGFGMGAMWKSRFGFSGISRTRTGSTSSNLTTRSSIFSEDLLEEDEDKFSTRRSSASLLSPTAIATDEESHSWFQLSLDGKETPRSLGVPIPPSAPAYKSSFGLPLRLSSKAKGKHRPSPLVGILPTVPSSPIPSTAPIHEACESTPDFAKPDQLYIRQRAESRRPSPPLHLRPRPAGSFSSTSSTQSSIYTPSQTLFVFPPSSSSMSTTMMVTATPSSSVPFPVLPTPRVATCRRHGRTRSFIDLGVPPTPTTAFSLVEVRGTIEGSSNISRA